MGKQRAAAATAVAKNEKYQKLNPEAKAAIVAQLRSGNYQKHTDQISRYYRNPETGEETFDISGVIYNTYAIVRGMTERTRQKFLNGRCGYMTYHKMYKWLGHYATGAIRIGYHKDGEPIYLQDVNDGFETRALSFAKIADLIEKRL